MNQSATPFDFDTLFGRLAKPFLLVHTSSKILAINAAAAKLFKLEHEEVIGQYWAGLDGQMTLIDWKKKVFDLRANGLLSYETDILTADELLRPVQVEITPAGGASFLICLQNQLADVINEADVELLSSEGEVGFWTYNRVDDSLYLSPHLRNLTNIRSGDGPLEIAQSLEANFLPADWTRLCQKITQLFLEPDSFNEFIHFEDVGGVRNLRVFAKSTGNDLQVTRLFGMVQPQNNVVSVNDTEAVSGELAAFSIDQAQELIFWTRPDGTVSYANQMVFDKLGFSREEIIGQPARVFASYFSTEAKDAWWAMLRKEKFHRALWRLEAKDGTIVEIDASVSYLRFGEEEYSCGFCRDVTKKRLADRRRMLTEFTLDNSRDMIIWARPDGRIHFANTTFLERTGYQVEDVINRDANIFFPHLSVEYQEKAWDRLRHGESLENEVGLNTSGGGQIMVASKIDYLSFEGEEFCCINLRDLTKKNTRDLQLLLSREALDISADCVLWLTDEFKVHYVNRTFLNLVGHKKDYLIGKSYGKLLPQLDRKMIEEEGVMDARVTAPDGVVHRLHLNSVRIGQGAQYFYMITGRDITAMADRKDELEAANLEISKLSSRLKEENTSLREQVSINYNINNIITVSPKYQKVLKQVGQVADVDTTVLITGETGTGKELLAQAIHQLSERAGNPFVKVNCAALPENLIESELFGHEKGAFTGAVARKRGRFELAHSGTLFLDEIGELPLELQSKLLRVLQEDEFERLGGTETINVDVRLIAATNRNLQLMVQQGTFRADLFYRLNVFPIVNLPLRDRPEDIPVLVDHFIRKFARRQRKNITKINNQDLKALKRYAFPGNIRELENLIERAVVLSQSEVLRIPLEANSTWMETGEKVFLSFEEAQRQHIIKALRKTDGRVTGPHGAGVLLGLNDRTLVSKMRKLDIRKVEYLIN